MKLFLHLSPLAASPIFILLMHCEDANVKPQNCDNRSTDAKGALQVDYIPHGEIIKVKKYHKILQKLRPWIIKKRPKPLSREVLLPHDQSARVPQGMLKTFNL